MLAQILFLQTSQWWSPTRIARYQEERVVTMLRYAVAKIPYYRALGVDPATVTSLADLARFPVLTKRTVQTEAERLLADGLDRSRMLSSRTSGSTCEPTTTYFDRASWSFTRHALKLRRTLAAINPLFKRILIVSEEGFDPPRRRRGLVDVARMHIRGDMEAQLAFLREYRPHALYSFPSYLLELVATCRESGVPVPRVPVVFTSSEVLSEAARSTITEVFGARLFDIYGSTEFKEIAWQCDYGRYHLNFESVYLEHASAAEADPETGARPLLVTSLTNRAMPFIRFDMGDLANINSPGRCRCGRRSPYLTDIGGRRASYLRLPSGRRISPYLLTTTVENDPAVRKYRFVQTAPDRLRLEYVRARGAGDVDRHVIEEALVKVVGEPIAVSFRARSDIPRAPGGKHHVVQVENPNVC